MERHGKTLKVLQDGHPRRMSDARNAWRKMSPEQRREFIAWAMPETASLAASLIDREPSGKCDPWSGDARTLTRLIRDGETSR